MSTVGRNFNIDLVAGEKAERDLASVLRKKLNGLKHIQKVDHKQYPYDLRLTIERGDGSTFDKTVEVKSLAGGYPTCVVEVWADDSKTKRPKWHHKDVDIIIFRDESRGKWFMYDAQRLITDLQKDKHHLTRCRNGNEASSGWITKFYWEEAEGFVTSFGE